MLRETLVGLDAVLRAADGPPQDHAQRRLRIGDGEGHDAGAAHAAADQVRALDLQVLEEQFALPRIVRPRDRLHAAAGLAALAPVEGDALEFLRQVLEQLDARIDALAAPL